MNPADALTIDKITPAADSYISAPCVVEGQILEKRITPGIQHSEQRTEEEHCAFNASERMIHRSNSRAWLEEIRHHLGDEIDFASAVSD